MNILLAAVITLSCTGEPVQQPETAVRETVQAFYAAFNSHDFSRAAEFTTDDWEHIDPFGGRTRGRSAVVEELVEVHGTFLKGVTDAVEEITVRLAAPDVALAIVPSRLGTFTSPDGVTHENKRPIRTFVLVKRGQRWLIMHDQNTFRAP